MFKGDDNVLIMDTLRNLDIKIHHDSNLYNLRNYTKFIELFKSYFKSTELNSINYDSKNEKDDDGALICDNDYFKMVYNFKMRGKDRSQEDVFIAIIDIEKVDEEELTYDLSKDSMEQLLDIAIQKLRKGDVITQWNENQILLLLSGLKEDNIEVLIKRINSHFYSMCRKRVKLSMKFQRI